MLTQTRTTAKLRTGDEYIRSIKALMERMYSSPVRSLAVVRVWVSMLCSCGDGCRTKNSYIL